MKRMFALVGLAALISTPAVAAERGFYFGLDAGQYTYDLDQNGIDGLVTDSLEDIGLDVLDGRSETSEDGFTYGIIFGYQILAFLAVRGRVRGPRRLRVQGQCAGERRPQHRRPECATHRRELGPTLSVLGILPIFGSGWELYGRAGVYFGGNDAEVQFTADGISESFSDSSNSTEFLWGVGAGYTRGDWTVRLDFQQFTDVGDSDSTGDVNVNRIVLGTIYRY